MENQTKQKRSRGEAFVSFVIERMKSDNAFGAALRRADNPDTEYQAWEYLAAWCDLEKPWDWLPFATVSASLARAKPQKDGALGMGQALIDESIKYANEREQFGTPIGKFQMVQEELARMIVENEAARLMVYRCAGQKDRGNLHNTLETCMAKYYSCDVVSRVADGALRILGAYGYSSEYPVERLLRDAKVNQILEGSANILKMIVASDALGYRKANR